MINKKKVCICHYRVGKTDGISLEIMKRKKALEEMGYQVKLLSGNIQKGADYVIPELEFDRKDIVKIKKNAFFKFKDYKNENELMKDVFKISDIIEEKFMKIQKIEKFNYLILHNIFSHGRHIAAAKAFFNISEKTNLKLIGMNHDFYQTYGIYNPQTSYIKKYLSEYVPPKSRKIKHIVINSLRNVLLKKLIGRTAMVFPDTFDFNQPSWKIDSYNKDFRQKFGIKDNDLIVLQATRIVERKAIELSIDFVSKLNKNKSKLIGNKLYNGKIFNKNSRIILVFAQFVEPASKEYLKKLKLKIKKEYIDFLFISDFVDYKRCNKNERKIYSLWDTYVYSDIVIFPSILEGWGNQFIEAIFAKKPIVIFEYPVFKKDIKPEGYNVISLGDKYKLKNGFVYISNEQLKHSVENAVKFLLDKNLKRVLDKNWKIGRKYHGDKALKKLLKTMLKF